jgi:hypothetical protein
MSRGARRSQEDSKFISVRARRSQGEPGGARRSQEDSKIMSRGAERSQEDSKFITGGTRRSWGARRSQE